MTTPKLPYGTWRQVTSAWETFVPGTGRTAETNGELFELMIDADAGYRVWICRSDTTGDHYGVEHDEAVALGLEG